MFVGTYREETSSLIPDHSSEGELMSNAHSAYTRLIRAAMSWSQSPEALREDHSALGAVAQHIYTLFQVAKPEARYALERSRLALSDAQQVETLADHVGASVAPQLREVVNAVLGSLQHTEPLDAVNAKLRALRLPEVVDMQLSSAQREIGSLFMDLLTDQRGDASWGKVVWFRSHGQLGASALSLLGVPLTPRERVALSWLFVQGLAELHQGHLEPHEGLAPEHALISADFTVIKTPTERTQIESLMSPELRSKTSAEKPSDVWTLARLLTDLYRGDGLASTLDGPLEIPKDIKAILKRSLHSRAKRRFYSGRELRVVLEKPIKRWRAQLAYEARHGDELIEAELTFDELTEDEEYQFEKRVHARRKLELKLRKRLQWRATWRQVLWTTVIISLFGGPIWWWFQHQREELNDALSKRAGLEARDYLRQSNQAGVSQAHRVQWRYVEMGPTRRPALVSVSKVTAAQYLHCVKTGACSPLLSKQREVPDGCVVEPTQQPINCISMPQAERYAKSVQAELLTLEDWRWLVFESQGVGVDVSTDKRRAYPWGDKVPSRKRAVLKLSNLPRHILTQPKEVCGRPLGDSPDALCDLVGNVHEWVRLSDKLQSRLLDELERATRDQAGEQPASHLKKSDKKSEPSGDVQSGQEAQSSPSQVVRLFAGVVGADWRTRSNALELEGFKVAKLHSFDEGVGFRVIRWLKPADLSPAQASGDSSAPEVHPTDAPDSPDAKPEPR